MIRFNNTNYGSLYGLGSYGSTNSIYSNLSQLSSVRSGAYSKALKAYYGKTNTSGVSQKNVLNNRTFLNNLYASKYDDVTKESSELISSAQKLTASGKDSLFANKEEYDSDKAYKAVNSFISEYNSTIDAVDKAENSRIMSTASSLTRMTDIFKKSLSSVGVSVGKDGKLSINEDTFKKADMNSVKSLFGSNGSYAKTVQSTAQRISSTASQQKVQNIGNYGLYGNYSSYGNYNSINSLLSNYSSSS